MYVGSWVLAFAASVALLALPPLLVALPALLVLGAAAGAIVPLEQTVWQERTPPELRARVFATATRSRPDKPDALTRASQAMH